MTQKVNVDKYLNDVKKALGDHPEADDIVMELRAHIWDYANQLSNNSKMSLSIDEAFTIAVQSMEDPQTMARSFRYEPSESLGSWMEPRSPIPEKKLSDRDFLFMGIIGFFAATIILSMISWVDQFVEIDLGTINFALILIQFLIVISLILGFLYYRNEQEFQSQLEKLRKKFEKIHDGKEYTDKGKQFVKAFELHFEGLFELIFVGAWLIGILYTSFISNWVLYTENWYNVGLYVMVAFSLIELFRASLKLFLGQIRITRLISAIAQLFAAFGSILLIIFYPFDLIRWFASFEDPTAIAIADWILSTTSQPDVAVMILFGISAVFEIMDSIYNLVKFGTWKPSHQKSLTMGMTKEE